MANVQHSSLTGSSLHEPKGVATAAANTVYAANGSGSGTWVDFNTLVTSTNFTTGDMKPTIKTVADSGWVMLNDGTLGDALSGGTTRANADTSALFTLLWTNISNTYAAVSGGRGASAAADYAAHKTIALPKALGRAIASAGAGSGLTSRSLGQTIGEENHTILEAELPAHAHTGVTGTENSFHTHNVVFNSSTEVGTHTHTLTVPIGSSQSVQSGAGATTYAYSSTSGVTSTESATHYHGISGTSEIENAIHTHSFTSNLTGSNTAHNNMQPSLFVNYMIKL